MADRTFNTPHRENWNAKIHSILKTIDLHTELHLKTGEEFHYYQAKLLRHYLHELKEWIHYKETKGVTQCQKNQNQK